MTTKRDDISEDLVHFIKGKTPQERFNILQKILNEKRLLGGTGFIKGQYRCVCFSEAPVNHLGRALTRPSIHREIPYQPFGIIVRKKWLYGQGGRPVFYQSAREFLDLPENLRWRHMRYEPDSEFPVDFTWEREWRIHADALPITPQTARIVLPTESWFRALEGIHDSEESCSAEMWSLVIGDVAQMLVHPFPWDNHIIEALDAGYEQPVTTARY